MAESAAVVVDTMNTMTTPAASSVRPRKRQRTVTAAPSTTAAAPEPQTITGVVRSATTDSTLEDSTTAHACNGGGAGGGAGAGAGTVVTASPSRPLLLPSRTVRAAAGVPVSPSTAKGAQAIVFCAAFDPVALYDVKTAAHAVLSITNVTQVPTDAVIAASHCP